MFGMYFCVSISMAPWVTSFKHTFLEESFKNLSAITTIKSSGSSIFGERYKAIVVLLFFLCVFIRFYFKMAQFFQSYSKVYLIGIVRVTVYPVLMITWEQWLPEKVDQ